MPDKRVAYLIFAFLVAGGSGSCRRAPEAGSPVVRLVDILEAKNVAARGARDVARLVSVIRELERAGRKPAGQKTVIDAETEEKLRALGYIR